MLLGEQVIICSDAALDGAKFSTFSWLIYYNTVLWQGEGVVPGHIEDVYAGRSEAFGILTALRFIAHYLQFYPKLPPKTSSLLLYCDSQSVLDCLTKLKDPLNRTPCTTITNDYDVYATIIDALHRLTPVSVKFLHIKGHQDKPSKGKRYLSLPAKLNIKCDKQAGKYLTVARSMKPLPNPQLPQGFPHLTIANQTIVWDIQESLWYAATTPDYREYMQKKHHWSTSDCQNVNWLSLRLTAMIYTL